MKKPIISLVLSTLILTASPLFAMEDSNEPAHKTTMKKTPPIDDDENSESQSTVNREKLIERAMILLKEIKSDKKTTDTEIRHGRYDSFILGTRASF